MRLYTSVRVGPRQWAVLLAAEQENPYMISAKMAGQAVRDGLPFSAHKPIVEGLVAQRLLTHECTPDDHSLTGVCRVAITERGAWARLNARGRAHTQP